MPLELFQFNHRIVRIEDRRGKVFTGAAEAFSSGSGLRGNGREEESIRIGIYRFFESDIVNIEPLPDVEILRATETWQQAGAYYVRIQAMARKHHITLRQEFDMHDTPETKYIVVTDKAFPIATARLYPLNGTDMMIGRVVVLPEYRRQGIGTMTVLACEAWAGELGYRKAVLESRDNKTAFYEQIGYRICGSPADGDTFRCVRMEKELDERHG
uniref:GCN5-related N-acetyltransferase n=1 Tax=uncultured bacterium Contig46 TaxID=1393580 RepID=W0FHC5_9BACT|nr:GCN5-related N-acetyltransferase [uncultured bacterium Contig46]